MSPPAVHTAFMPALSPVVRRAVFLERGMWILTILLLFQDGSAVPVTKQFTRTVSPDECVAAARDMYRLREIGLHVISVTCSRAKEA